MASKKYLVVGFWGFFKILFGYITDIKLLSKQNISLMVLSLLFVGILRLILVLGVLKISTVCV